MKFNVPFFGVRSGKAGIFCSPLACKLGLTALLAIGLALPGRADDLKTDVETPITTPSSTPAVTASDFTVVDTVLPNGVVRHTVRRVTPTPTDLDNTSFPTNQIALGGNAQQMLLGSDVLAMGRQGGPGRRFLPLDLRLGVSVSPRIKFVGGIDYTIAGLGLGRGFSTRVDLDAVVSANFGGVSTLVPLTIDEIFRFPMGAGTNIYVGAGVGPMFGETTRFGGKVLVGGHLSPRFSLEGTVLFAGYGDALFNVQARFPLF